MVIQQLSDWIRNHCTSKPHDKITGKFHYFSSLCQGGGKEAFVKVYEHIEGKMDEMKKK